jgi:hypothetical protein
MPNLCARPRGIVIDTDESLRETKKSKFKASLSQREAWIHVFEAFLEKRREAIDKNFTELKPAVLGTE